MSLWDWALAKYEKPGVAQMCLILQDSHRQQTAYLLWAAWAAPSDAVLAEGARLARYWETTILGPVRQSRRALKDATALVEDEARLAVRETVKAVELELEKLLMASLERLAPQGDEHPWESFMRAGEAWGDPAPTGEYLKLSRALE